MAQPLTARQEAEAIEQFGDDLADLMRGFDNLCRRMSSYAHDEINGIPNQDQLDVIAKAFQAVGARMSRDLDAAEEADDRRPRSPSSTGRAATSLPPRLSLGPSPAADGDAAPISGDRVQPFPARRLRTACPPHGGDAAS